MGACENEYVEKKLTALSRVIFPYGMREDDIAPLCWLVSPVRGASYQQRLVQAAAHDLVAACCLHLVDSFDFEHCSLENVWIYLEMANRIFDATNATTELDELFNGYAHEAVWDDNSQEYVCGPLLSPEPRDVAMYRKFQHSVPQHIKQAAAASAKQNLFDLALEDADDVLLFFTALATCPS